MLKMIYVKEEYVYESTGAYVFEVPNEDFDVEEYLPMVLRDYIKTEKGKKEYENAQYEGACSPCFILDEIPQEFFKPYGFHIVDIPKGKSICIDNWITPVK